MKKYYRFILIILVLSVWIGVNRGDLSVDLPEDSSAYSPKFDRGAKVSTGNVSNMIIDKVFTFTIEQPILLFPNISLESYYFYNISIGVVTPHTCTMEFSFWDPHDTRYDLIFRNLRQVYNITEYSKDKFLAVFNGTYALQFKAITSENLNIHLRLEKGIKLPPPIEPYITPNVITDNLDNDWYYNITFERGSGSVETSGKIWIDHIVLDPNNISFSIYNYKELGDEQLNYMFGTATNGTYTFNMTYYHEQRNLIVIIIIDKINKISNEIFPEPYYMLPHIPDDDPINDTKTGIEAFIPREWTIAMIVFVGSAVGIPILIVVYRKKKNPTGI